MPTQATRYNSRCGHSLQLACHSLSCSWQHRGLPRTCTSPRRICFGYLRKSRVRQHRASPRCAQVRVCGVAACTEFNLPTAMMYRAMCMLCCVPENIRTCGAVSVAARAVGRSSSCVIGTTVSSRTRTTVVVGQSARPGCLCC